MVQNFGIKTINFIDQMVLLLSPLIDIRLGINTETFIAKTVLLLKVEADPKKKWYKNGELHRLDGPAIEYSYRSGEWYQNGKLHREDGPATESLDGIYTAWYKEGKMVKRTERAFIIE